MSKELPKKPDPYLPLRVETRGQTTAEIADRLYFGITYDTALPQLWVDEYARYGYNPVGDFVWIYPEGYIMGMPGPLCQEAKIKLEQTITKINKQQNTNREF